MTEHKTITDYIGTANEKNIQAHLELIDRQMAYMEAMMKPTVTVTEKTLRDEFAMAALGGINTKEFNPNEIAEKAYAIADAMKEKRK